DVSGRQRSGGRRCPRRGEPQGADHPQVERDAAGAPRRPDRRAGADRLPPHGAVLATLRRPGADHEERVPDHRLLRDPVSGAAHRTGGLPPGPLRPVREGVADQRSELRGPGRPDDDGGDDDRGDVRGLRPRGRTHRSRPLELDHRSGPRRALARRAVGRRRGHRLRGGL
ncbi:MAG: hypothetical protein AVDCRST_MAG47-1566, partial [uncultured Nocardioidaceae bacterium]